MRFIFKSEAVSGRPALRRLRAGVTLVELLIVMVITVIVAGAGMGVFQLATRQEAHQQDVLEQTQNLRAALYAVARDVRMAGNGLNLIGASLVQVYVPPVLFDNEVQREAGWFRYLGADQYGVRAIYGFNSGADASKPDTLVIFRSEIEAPNPIGQLSASFEPGVNNSLTLQNPIEVNEVLSKGDIIAVANGSTAVILEAEPMAAASPLFTGINLGSRFRPAETFPGGGGLEFPIGSQVYNLRDVTFVTYYVDTVNKRLMANYHDDTIVADFNPEVTADHRARIADNIEDFQVGYYYSGSGLSDPPLDPEINETKLDGAVVEAVKLALVSRAGQRSDVAGEGATVEVMSHEAAGDSGYSRRVMAETVNLRNY
ncbi:MAG: PilW family protein [Candidatus Adiutrix sp.]|nr:PilW family protein [Candidatus Adiutrix sp.]